MKQSCLRCLERAVTQEKVLDENSMILPCVLRFRHRKEFPCIQLRPIEFYGNASGDQAHRARSKDPRRPDRCSCRVSCFAWRQAHP